MKEKLNSISEQYLTALLDISQKINSIQDFDELLSSVLDIALEQLSAERGFILLKEDEGDELIARAVRNMQSEKLAEMADISHSTVQKVQETSQPILTFDALSDDRFDAAQSIMLHKIRSIACVPFLLREKLLGLLYIDSRNEKARLTKQSLAFLQAFANQAAIALENARLLQKLQTENAILKEEFHRIYSFKEIIGKSNAMQRVFQMMGKVLDNETTVLITGPSGTGKELVARAIHYNGRRKDEPFVAINCGAIPENLIESELFGHKKGAFTGAVSDKKGLIESANGGTLFLDEVGELPLTMQVKLLRFLQDHQFNPVGDVRTRQADVRIVSATNRNLQEAIEEGLFREDLFYRLNVIQIPLPPLKERLKDIPLLAQHFLKTFSKKLGKKVTGCSGEALDLLQEYDWPGNVRELENAIERAVVMDSDGRIGIDDLVLATRRKPTAGIEAGLTLNDLSKQLLEKTLAAVDGNKTRAAEMMGVSLRWVHYKMKEWNIPG